jgi:Carboxypeptidase regulatory-like domain
MEIEMKRDRTWKAFLAIVLFMSGVAFAQIPDRAEITGRITDESGAVMSGVLVTLQNDATGFKSSQRSSGTGDFVFQFLPIGSYTLTAELPKFVILKVTSIQVTLNQHLDLGKLTLKVEGFNAQVNVTAEANQIETSTAAIRTIMTEKQIKDLPVMTGAFGRSIQFTLLQLAPGSSDVNEMSGSDDRQGKWSINGSPVAGVGFSFNGIDNTGFGVYGGGPLSGGPNQDAVSEFSILTQTFNADAGNMSAQVSLETKGGTNNFHGQLRAIHLDPTLTAHEFFNALSTALYRTEVGAGQFSGPISLPGIYSGRNKTFFFVDTELERSRLPFTYTATVLTDAERIGDFSSLPPEKWPIDPLTGKAFPDGRIPADRVLPQSRRFIDELMHPPTSGNNVTQPWTDHLRTHQNTARIDHRFSERDALQLNFYEDKWFEADPLVSMQDREWLYRQWSSTASVRHTHAFSSRTINSFAFGRSYNKFDSEYGGKLSGKLQDNGFNISSDVNWGYPWVNVGGSFVATGDHSFNRPSLWTIKDDFAIVSATHSLKSGIAVRAERDENTLSPVALFTFSNNNPNGTGNQAADLLLGLPSQYLQDSGPDVSPRRFFTAFYIQDDWKARSNLTLNLGLRYEIAKPWGDATGHRAVFRPGAKSTIVPDAPVGMLFPGDLDPLTHQTLGKTVSATDANNWGPRIGISYAPSSARRFVRNLLGSAGRSSIRAGYGVYYLASPRDAIYSAYTVPPWGLTTILDASQLQQFGGTFLNPWGNSLDPFTLPAEKRGVVRPVGGLVYVEPQAREPYQQQWSLSISRQLPSHVGLSVSYLGNSALHLYRKYQVNPGLLTPTATVNNVQSRRLYSEFQAIWALATDGHSNYNALQVDVNRRFTSTFQFNASYVWSKALDNAGTGNPGMFLSVADRDATPWARSNYDRPHQFVFSSVWDLPRSPLRWLSPILSGWQLTSIVQLRTGVPINLRNQWDSTLRGGEPTTAEIRGTFQRLNPREIHTFTLPTGNTVTGHFIFDPTVFATLSPGPDAARPGNLGRNVFTGLGRNNVDASLMKTFTIAERHRIQLRMDMANVFNHAQFVPTNRNYGNVSNFAFAQTNRTTGPRRVQFAFKYNF